MLARKVDLVSTTCSPLIKLSKRHSNRNNIQMSSAAQGGKGRRQPQIKKPNVFLSLLQQAGKPASLHITSFDLPESYGIVDASFRTKKMAHTTRYRLSSASRAAERKRQELERAQATTAPTVTDIDGRLLVASVRTTLRCSMDDESEHLDEPNASRILSSSSPHPAALLEPVSASALVTCNPNTSVTADCGGSSLLLQSSSFCIEKTVVDTSNHLLSLTHQQLETSRWLSRDVVPEAPQLADTPCDLSRLHEAKLRVMPLSEIHVALLRPEPTDPQTGASLLRETHITAVHQWIEAQKRIHQQQLHTTQSLPEVAASPADTTKSPRRLQQRKKSVSPEQTPERNGAKRQSVFVHTARKSLFGQQAGDTEGDDHEAPLDISTLQFRSPLAHLNNLDPVYPLLQATHYYAHKSSWLALAVAASGASLATLASESEQRAHQRVSSASVLRESAADPTLLQQRMLTVLLSESELVALRGAFDLANRCGDAFGSSVNKQSFDSPTFPLKAEESFSDSGMASSQRAAAMNSSFTGRIRSIGSAAKIVKASNTDRTSPMIGFTDVVKRAVKSADGPSQDNLRVQLKIGASSSHLRVYHVPQQPAEASRSLLATSSSNSKGINPFNRGTSPASAVTPSLSEWLPEHVKSMPAVRANPQNAWDTAFQSLLDSLYTSSSVAASIELHKQVVELHSAFIGACSALVERTLLSGLLDSVQIVQDGILMSLLTAPADTQQQFNNKSFEAPTARSAGLDSSQMDANTEIDVAPTMADSDEASRKISSANLRAMSMLSRAWYKTGAHDIHGSPFANAENTPLLATAPQILSKSVYRSVQREVKGKKERRDTVFPLSCVVHYLGFVVSCTAKLPAEVEQSAAPVSRVPRPSHLLDIAGCAAGISPYVERTDNNTVQKVATSRLVVLGEYPAPLHDKASGAHCAPRSIVLAAPTMFPPLIPTMKYSPWLRLRPEFTSRIPDEIPSDVFSSTVPPSHFPEKATAQANAVKVARKLLHKNVTDLIQCWETSSEPLRGEELCAAMHRKGINMSLLGYIGDLLFTKIKSVTAILGGGGNVAASSNDEVLVEDDGKEGDTTATGRALDALNKALTTVKEEMAVRSFRVHWNCVLREKCLFSNLGPDSSTVSSLLLPSMKATTTELVKQFLGNETDPLVSTFWSRVITTHVREHFRFRAPLGRKDLSLRTTLMRIESLCGVVLSPGTAKDALNASMLSKHQELLSIDLRNTRAIAIGSVLELRPYVKAVSIPHLPPLWHLPDAENTRVGDVLIKYLVQQEQLSTESQGLFADYTLHMQERHCEALFSQGEHYYEACETFLLKWLVRLQQQPVPLYHEASEVCLHLSRVFLASHRNIDATRCADDAIAVASALSHSAFYTPAGFLFATFFSAARESGNREMAIHALERSIAHSVKRIEQLQRDPYHTRMLWNTVPTAASDVEAPQPPEEQAALASVGDFLSSPGPAVPTKMPSRVGAAHSTALPADDVMLCPLQRQVVMEQCLLFNSIEALVDAYKAMSYHTLHEPLPFHESVATPLFLNFLFELGSAKAGKSPVPEFSKVGSWAATVDLSGAKSIFSRASHLSEILQLKSGNSTIESQVVAVSRANFAALSVVVV